MLKRSLTGWYNWWVIQRRGASDEYLKRLIQHMWSLGSYGGPDGRYWYKGGCLEFTFEVQVEGSEHEGSIRGRSLIDAVRRIFQVPAVERREDPSYLPRRRPLGRLAQMHTLTQGRSGRWQLAKLPVSQLGAEWPVVEGRRQAVEVKTPTREVDRREWIAFAVHGGVGLEGFSTRTQREQDSLPNHSLTKGEGTGRDEQCGAVA
jgi:hypothetical protein